MASNRDGRCTANPEALRASAIRRQLDRVTIELAALRAMLDAVNVHSEPEPEPELEAQLRAACRERGIPISVEGEVSEADAADLLGRAPNTLRNWRMQHEPIAWRKSVGRVCYKLSDIADFLSEQSD